MLSEDFVHEHLAWLLEQNNTSSWSGYGLKESCSSHGTQEMKYREEVMRASHLPQEPSPTTYFFPTTSQRLYHFQLAVYTGHQVFGDPYYLNYFKDGSTPRESWGNEYSLNGCENDIWKRVDISEMILSPL